MAKDYAKELAERRKEKSFLGQAKMRWNEFLKDVNKMKTLFQNEIQMAININKPPLYQETVLLINEIRRVKKDIVRDLKAEDVQAVASAELLCQDLKQLLDNYDTQITKVENDKEIDDATKAKRKQKIEFNLAKEAIDTLYEYTPAFVDMPGFWRQLMSNIINYLDSVLTSWGLLEQSMVTSSGLQKTEFFQDENYELFKKFDDVKQKISEVRNLSQQVWIKENIPGMGRSD